MTASGAQNTRFSDSGHEQVEAGNARPVRLGKSSEMREGEKGEPIHEMQPRYGGMIPIKLTKKFPLVKTQMKQNEVYFD